MGLALHLEKERDTADACVYAFGSPQETVGRVRVDKTSGDIELLELSETDSGPSKQFYLAELVPRLHDYHDRDQYPASEQWSV